MLIICRKAEINVLNNSVRNAHCTDKKSHKELPQNVFCYFIKQMWSKRVQCQFAGCLVGDVRPWSHFEAPWNKPWVAECVFRSFLQQIAWCRSLMNPHNFGFLMLESLIKLIIDWYFATWSSCPWGLGRCSSQDGCSQTWSCVRTSTLRGSPQSWCRWVRSSWWWWWWWWQWWTAWWQSWWKLTFFSQLWRTSGTCRQSSLFLHFHQESPVKK